MSLWDVVGEEDGGGDGCCKKEVTSQKLHTTLISCRACEWPNNGFLSKPPSCLCLPLCAHKQGQAKGYGPITLFLRGH